MKRDRKMTIRFDGAESMTNGRKAAGDVVRMNSQLRVVPDLPAEDDLQTTSEPAADRARTPRPPVQDEIQALEQLIRQENGAVAQRDHDMKLDNEVGIDSMPYASGPSVWTFPEPIKPIKPVKTKFVDTERKPNSAANRIEDAGYSNQHHSPSTKADAGQDYKPGRTAAAAPAELGLPALPVNTEDKTYHIPDWDMGRLDSGETSGRFGIRPAIADYSHTRLRGPSWLKVFASVAGAIATGALFGYLALALFAGQGPWSGSSDGEGTSAKGTNTSNASVATSGASDQSGNLSLPAIGDNGVNGSAKPVGQNDTNPPIAAEGTASNVSLDLQAQSFHALQYGVFSSAEGADTAVSDLADQGLAAYRWDTDSDYRVYVGMSADRDGALALSQLLDGMEVYVKEIELPAVATMPFSGDSKLLQKYWAETEELIAMLDRLTLGQLALKSPKPLSEAESAAWKKLHEQWLTTSAAVASKLAGEQDKKASDQLAQSINTAAVSLAEFDKKPSSSHLWNAQSALMSAVFAEKGWLESSRGL